MTTQALPPASPGAGLVGLEEARARMLAGLVPLGVESVPLEAALGRVLAEPISSALTLPPWDNSAMDGYAVRAADVAMASSIGPVRLRVVGEVAAGHAPTVVVDPGTAVRVLTGGMLPPGSDAVVPVEDTDAPAGMAVLPADVAIRAAPTPGADIRRAGSDVQVGDRLLEPGIALGPAALAVLAASGRGEVQVHIRPRVAILATGDELVPAGQPLGPAGIPDSNSIGLAAQAAATGADVERLGIARDRLDDVLERLRAGVASADVVIGSGGVSVGAHDVVKEAFERLGRLELWRVAVQPGKPLAYGRATRADGSEARFFGLPGNPVSSFVTYELFVRPVIRRLAGHSDPLGRVVVRASLDEPVRKASGRRAFLRVRLVSDPERTNGWRASLAGAQGSHVLSALAAADGLAVIPEDVDGLPEGAEVDVIRLDLESM